jgi:uncharacterized protein YukE
MDKINMKGVAFWCEGRFQKATNDWYLPREKVEELLENSRNLLEHSKDSVEMLESALTQNIMELN